MTTWTHDEIDRWYKFHESAVTKQVGSLGKMLDNLRKLRPNLAKELEELTFLAFESVDQVKKSEITDHEFVNVTQTWTGRVLATVDVMKKRGQM